MLFDPQVSRSEFASYCEESSHFFVNEQVSHQSDVLNGASSNNLIREQCAHQFVLPRVAMVRRRTRWASGRGGGATSWTSGREGTPSGDNG